MFRLIAKSLVFTGSRSVLDYTIYNIQLCKQGKLGESSKLSQFAKVEHSFALKGTEQ
jgi:hypothetical protein